jgi:hypothetical protein
MMRGPAARRVPLMFGRLKLSRRTFVFGLFAGGRATLTKT